MLRHIIYGVDDDEKLMQYIGMLKQNNKVAINKNESRLLVGREKRKFSDVLSQQNIKHGTDRQKETFKLDEKTKEVISKEDFFGLDSAKIGNWHPSVLKLGDNLRLILQLQPTFCAILEIQQPGLARGLTC